MLIARAGTDAEPVLLLGLSRVNVERLIAGQPIKITRQSHGDGIPQGWTISIMFGETEQDILRALETAGAVGPDTKQHIDPRL